MPADSTIKLRKGTSSEWANINPVLASGEPGYDSTNNILKVGDGVNSYSNLPVLFSGVYQPTGNYTTIGHSHTSSDITDFNSSVSGLLPITDIIAGTGISISSANKVFTINSTGSTSNEIFSYESVANFPASGTTNTIYLSNQTSRIYTWNGSSYNELGSIGGNDDSRWNLFVPGIPTSVSGEAGNSLVNLSWVAPFSAVSITDYSIQYSSNSGVAWTTFDDGVSTSTSASVTGLTNGTSYIFRVAAINSIGSGSYSSASSSVSAGADPYFANVSLLLHMDGSNNGTTFTDSSSIGHTVTRVNTVTSTTQSKFGGSSAYFDGNSYLSLASHSSLDLGTADFTIEFWAYCSEQPNTYPTYLASQGGWNFGAYGIRFDNGNNKRFGWFKNPSDPVFSSDNTFSTNQWRHVALVRESGRYRLYIDGVQEGTSTTGGSDSIDLTHGGTMRIGWSTWDGAAGYLQDYVDEFRITKGVCRYTGGTTFSPPTSPFFNS